MVFLDFWSIFCLSPIKHLVPAPILYLLFLDSCKYANMRFIGENCFLFRSNPSVSLIFSLLAKQHSDSCLYTTTFSDANKEKELKTIEEPKVN